MTKNFQMTDEHVEILATLLHFVPHDELELQIDLNAFCHDARSAISKAAQPEQEPYGFFKAEPFGWIDCEETDEGAIPLYEKPFLMFQPLTDEDALDLLPTNTSMSRNDALIWVLRATERAHGIKEAK